MKSSTPAPRRWSWAWLIWLAAFLCVEIPGALAKRAGATFSENVWDWFSIRERKPLWKTRRVILGAFLATLSAHFMTGGAYPLTEGVAVIVAGVPVALTIVLSSLFERPGGGPMSGLLAKLLKPAFTPFLKRNWGKLLPLAL
jgi:hypothetical protein